MSTETSTTSSPRTHAFTRPRAASIATSSGKPAAGAPVCSRPDPSIHPRSAGSHRRPGDGTRSSPPSPPGRPWDGGREPGRAGRRQPGGRLPGAGSVTPPSRERHPAVRRNVRADRSRDGHVLPPRQRRFGLDADLRGRAPPSRVRGVRLRASLSRPGRRAGGGALSVPLPLVRSRGSPRPSPSPRGGAPLHGAGLRRGAHPDALQPRRRCAGLGATRWRRTDPHVPHALRRLRGALPRLGSARPLDTTRALGEPLL